MPTLAEITRETRIGGKFVSIAAAVLIVLFLSFQGILIILRIINPPQIVPPDQKYGQLQTSLIIPANQPKLTYQLNTIIGNLPVFPDRVRVYKIKQPESELLALQKARETLNLPNIGYSTGERLIQPDIYEWSNSIGGKITYNIKSKNFQVLSGIPYNDTGVRFDQNHDLTSDVLEYVQTLGADTSDIDQQNPKIQYYTANGTTLVPQENKENAYLARVDLYQNEVLIDPFTLQLDEAKNIESLPIYYENPDTSNQSFLVKAGDSNTTIVSGTYKHFFIDTSDFGTYPIKTSADAYNDLQNGRAVIFPNDQTETVYITEVSLAYYMPAEGGTYLFPIYIFKGKDFTAYVDALGKTSDSQTQSRSN
jgi:hypothetical protein